MKHIVKGNEPREFTRWKDRVNDPGNDGWRPLWGNFQNPEKTIVHNSFLHEQGSICCYCMQMIDRFSSHFEHVKPREVSKQENNEEEQLSYGDMLASCGKDDGKPENLQVHCGQHRGRKGNWYDPDLFVSPLHPDCESRFRFYDDGMIRAVDGDSGAEKTIESLGLDYTLLVKNRKAAIIDATRDLQMLPDQEIAQRFREFSARSADGRFKEYCVAVKQVLSRLVPSGLLNQGN